MWQELIQNINELVIVYQKLFSLNEEKRSAIISINMEKLSKIIEDEKKLTEQILNLEQKRQKIILKLVQNNNIPISKLKAIDLQTICPSTWQLMFKKVNQELLNIVEKTTSLNENNIMLLQGALTAVNINLNKLTDTKANPDYGKDGRQNFSQQKREFNIKA